MERGPDRRQIYGLALAELARLARSWAAYLESRLRSAVRPAPKRLTIAPQDLRTSDPTVAADIYSGYFVFAGRALSAGGRSPFEHEPPSRAWGAALYGFGWLGDLRAADTALARANARALVGDFLKKGGDRRLARDTPVLARRLISFLSQSPLILDGAEHGLYRRYLHAVGRAARDLEADTRGAALPYPRLQASIALVFAGLCCEGFDGVLRRSTRMLARELERQILADGGHCSRNPTVVLDILLDLLPLRQAFASRGIEPPEALLRAIDRMLPHLRLLRVGHNTLAHFNGTGATAADQLATLLMYEGRPGQAMRRAPQSGYERLSAGPTTLIADVGRPPPLLQSSEAHAGCLSFELWHEAQPVVVNCGAPAIGGAARHSARATAAHSTAAIDDASSCRFLAVEGRGPERWISSLLLRRLGPVILDGPGELAVERGESEGAPWLAARHDGYRALGVTHERRWRLAPRGDRLEGADTFALSGEAGSRPAATIRFHLAPGMATERLGASKGVALSFPTGEAWRFGADTEIAIEDSAFFAATEGTRRTEQLVLRVPVTARTSVSWDFERVSGPASQPGVPRP